jgi:isoquinoline 1-oxidoreductase beta subunit
MRWPTTAVDRRSLLIGGGAGIGLIVAFAAWPRRPGSPLRGGEGEQVFGPYLRIASDGRVTVAVPQAETGQGAWTGLAQVAADELGAAWETVAVEPAPLAPGYANDVVGDTRLTAQSSSIRAFEGPMREAAATARTMLCAAAAARWGVEPGACEARDGFVISGAQRLGFGALVEEAAEMRAPETPALRQGVLAGKALPRLDLPAKASGGLRFAGDVRLPGLRFASARIAPPGGRVRGFDRAAAEAGGARVVANERWIAAVAATTWAANRALDAAAVRFDGPAEADTPAIEQALNAALEGPMAAVVDAGDYDAAIEGRRPLAATYRIAPTPHLSLEPASVTARFSGDRLELWVATIAPDLARAAAAKAAGFGEGPVTLYPRPVGEGGGGAAAGEAIDVAIAVARAARAPVALTLNAATSQNHGALRPPLAARISALGDAAGGLSSWHGRFAGAAGLDAALARAKGAGVPDFVARGAVPPYAAGAVRIESATARLPITCGYLRGDVEALASFANESFIDELARARGVEPLAFRIGLLGGQPRLARALSQAAARGGWDGGARGSSLGIACASGFGSFIGLLAEASIGPDQRIQVTRLVAAVDAGRLVNPGLVTQQVEGGLLHALVSATGAAPEIIAGMPRARALGALGLPTLKGLPKVEVVLLPSGAAPGGVSGLGALVLPAAVGNAIHAATGMRLRRLPFDPMNAA